MLGSRRRFHKQQQEQQALQGTYAGSSQRLSLPAPDGMNTRDNAEFLPLNQSPLLENALPTDGGLLVAQVPRKRIELSSTSANSYPYALVTYNGCGSTSAEMWAFVGTKIYNVGDSVDAGVGSTTASAQTKPGSFGSEPYSWTEFNRTIIMVNGSAPLKWNRASAWEVWSATASGGNIANFWGINHFKSRLYGWEKGAQSFWYGSTDQVLGTFNNFDLSQVMAGNLRFMASLTRDGGAGPDDYALFVSDDGDCAVYQGNDPGDSNNWSLVGTYKIGRPLSRSAWQQYGQQLVVLCEDDFYFLPQDFVGKRQSTTAAEKRAPDPDNLQLCNAAYWPREGFLVFSEGSLLSTKRQLSYSTITLTSSPPNLLRRSTQDVASDSISSYPRPPLAIYKGDLFLIPTDTNTSANLELRQVFPQQGTISNRRARVVTAPIQTSGRTNISMVNPVFTVAQGRPLLRQQHQRLYTGPPLFTMTR